MNIQSLSDIGRTRKDNQDNYWSSILNVEGEEVGVVCVCDGMGGLNDGGTASKMVVTAIKNAILSGVDILSLEKVIKEENLNIFKISEEKGRMGTTCTVLYCQGDTYQVFHIGDSRCYKLSSDGTTEQVSIDHSVINKYKITKESNEKCYNKYKNSLTRCIGVKQDIELDHYTGTYVKGDSFLLCSDGFWHLIGNNLVETSKDIRKAIDLCIARGEKDNITVSILQI